MSSRRRITTLPTTLSLALAALLFAATGRAPGAPPARKGDADHWRSLETLLEQAVERASASTVAIVTSTSANGVRLRTGTAVTEGLVLTDATFLEGLAEPITVIDAQGRRFEAHRAGLDQRLRIAALRVSSGALVGVERAPPARPGLFAIACGRARPGSRRATPTLGIISAIGRFSGRATQVSCKLSTANAGGPVVDLDGRAFGVAIRLTRRTGDDSGVGFCSHCAGDHQSIEGFSI